MSPLIGIYADGFAVMVYDPRSGSPYEDIATYRWYDQYFSIPRNSVESEMHDPWGRLARVDDVRKAWVRMVVGD